MKRIMVTGGAGFIGSAFIRYQLSSYPEVHIVNFDKLTYAGNPDNLKEVDESRYTFFKGDIADANAVNAASRAATPSSTLPPRPTSTEASTTRRRS